MLSLRGLQIPRICYYSVFHSWDVENAQEWWMTSSVHMGLKWAGSVPPQISKKGRTRTTEAEPGRLVSLKTLLIISQPFRNII